MRRTSIGLLTAVSLALVGGPSTATAALSKADAAAIREVFADWAEAARAGKWGDVEALYAEDAVLLLPNRPAIEGSASILAQLTTLPPITDLSVEILEVDGGGSLAYARARYSLTMQIDGIGPVKDSGKALSILTKHRNGAWYILRDTYSSDFPWGRVPVAPIE